MSELSEQETLVRIISAVLPRHCPGRAWWQLMTSIRRELKGLRKTLVAAPRARGRKSSQPRMWMLSLSPLSVRPTKNMFWQRSQPPSRCSVKNPWLPPRPHASASLMRKSLWASGWFRWVLCVAMMPVIAYCDYRHRHT
jgi:hypothetical protein